MNSESTLLQFEVGCRRCDYLERFGKNSYICSIKAHLDDSPVIPIKDGVKTEDWNICNGEYYNRSKQNGSIRIDEEIGMAISKSFRALYTENDQGYVFSPGAFSELITEKYKDSRLSAQPMTKEKIREAIADITYKSPESVKKWEKGDNGPSDIQVVKDIAKYFDVDFHALLTSIEHTTGRKVPEIYASDERSIIMQLYSILVDFIYDYVGSNNTCYAIKHLGNSLTTEDVSGYIYDVYRQLDKVSFNISETTYNKLHRIVTECKTLGDLGYPPVPYLDLWVSINKRWKELNPRLEVIGQYEGVEDYWDAKEDFEPEAFDELMKPFREEVGQMDVEIGGVPTKEDFSFFDSYQLVPMELVKTLKLLFRNEFPELSGSQN